MRWSICWVKEKVPDPTVISSLPAPLWHAVRPAAQVVTGPAHGAYRPARATLAARWSAADGQRAGTDTGGVIVAYEKLGALALRTTEFMAFHRGGGRRGARAWYLRLRIIRDRPNVFQLGAFADILIDLTVP